MPQFIYYLLILTFSLLSFHVTAQTFPQNENNEIKKVIESYYAAWNKHDAKAMAALYAKDGDIRMPWNEYGTNREQIEGIFADEQAKKMKNAHIEEAIKTIRMVKPDIAFVDVESTIKGMQSNNQQQFPHMHHHVVYVLVKREGKWEILIGRPF